MKVCLFQSNVLLYEYIQLFYGKSTELEIYTRFILILQLIPNYPYNLNYFSSHSFTVFNALCIFTPHFLLSLVFSLQSFINNSITFSIIICIYSTTEPIYLVN